MVAGWGTHLLAKFPPGTTPTILYLGVVSKHHQSCGSFLLAGSDFFGTGDNREELTDFALDETFKQFRAFRDNGHCSALIGCDGEIGALTAMAYVANGVRALATPTLVDQLPRQ